MSLSTELRFGRHTVRTCSCALVRFSIFRGSYSAPFLAFFAPKYSSRIDEETGVGKTQIGSAVRGKFGKVGVSFSLCASDRQLNVPRGSCSVTDDVVTAVVKFGGGSRIRRSLVWRRKSHPASSTVPRKAPGAVRPLSGTSSSVESLLV